MGCVACKCVGKAIEHHSQICFDPVGPVLLEILAVLVLEAHRSQSAHVSVVVAVDVFHGGY